MDKLVVKGFVEVILVDAETKEVLHREVGENLVVAQGRQYIRANIIQATAQYNGNYITLSTSSTAPTDSETTTPNVLAYKAVSSRSIVNVGGTDWCQWSTTFDTTEGNGTIYSVALNEDVNGNQEWARYVLASPITKSNTQQLVVNYRISVSAA